MKSVFPARRYRAADWCDAVCLLMHARLVVRNIVPMVLITRLMARVTVVMRVAVHIVSHVRAGNPDLQRGENALSLTLQSTWERVIQIPENVNSGFP